MAKVRDRDTGPEVLLRRSMHSLGLRGWRCHRPDLPGRPDIAFGRARLAVFVDGAFWHGHPSKYWPGRTSDYWDAKIARNQARDGRADAALAARGWAVLRIWDFEVEREPEVAARRVLRALDDIRAQAKV